jgi:hypothetical protein
MDDTQLESVLKKLIVDVQEGLNERIELGIINHVKKVLDNYDYEGKINLLASLKLDNKISEFEIRPIDVEEKLRLSADAIIASLDKQAKSQIVSDIARRIDTIDFTQSVTNAVAQQFEAHIGRTSWPADSINFSAIKQNEIKITGDAVSGGIIKSFSSTGIDDRATDCKVTILDESTIIENGIITTSADIKGDVTIDGDLLLKGTIPSESLAFKNIVENASITVKNSLNEELFDSFSNTIFTKIKNEGIDLNQITMDGEAAITGNKIGIRITESNLQKLGVVRELQTSGETFLSESLYISNRRVGVNTIDPGHALSVWDQEVEIVTGKRSQDVGMIGTVRNQDLLVTSNNKNNLICKPDGSVHINTLQVGSVTMTSSNSIPNDDRSIGTIVWNQSPVIGNPIGWVSLGGARWAKFGIIE